MLQHELKSQGVTEKQGNEPYVSTIHRVYYYCICGELSGVVFQVDHASIWPEFMNHLGWVKRDRESVKSDLLNIEEYATHAHLTL